MKSHVGSSFGGKDRAEEEEKRGEFDAWMMHKMRKNKAGQIGPLKINLVMVMISQKNVIQDYKHWFTFQSNIEHRQLCASTVI